jgi:hypothetical protein
MVSMCASARWLHGGQSQAYRILADCSIPEQLMWVVIVVPCAGLGVIQPGRPPSRLGEAGPGLLGDGGVGASGLSGMSGLDDPLITAPMGTLGAAELHGVMPVQDAMHMPYVSLNSTSPGVSDWMGRRMNHLMSQAASPSANCHQISHPCIAVPGTQQCTHTGVAAVAGLADVHAAQDGLQCAQEGGRWASCRWEAQEGQGLRVSRSCSRGREQAAARRPTSA